MTGNAGRYCNPKILERHLHADLNGGKAGKGHLSSGEFPEHDGEAPHVGSPDVDVGLGALQSLGRHPGRLVDLVPLLEGKLGVCHVDPGREVVVDQNMEAVQVKARYEWLERVQEGHPARYVECKLHRLLAIDHELLALVQQAVERAQGQVLAHHNQAGRLLAAADHWQHVRVRENPQARVLLGEVAHYASRALWSVAGKLGANLDVVPAASPSFAAGCDGHFGVEVEIFERDARVPGQVGVPGALVELVLELAGVLVGDFARQILVVLGGQLDEPGQQLLVALVDGRLAVHVGHVGLGAGRQELLGDVLEGPEAGVVERRVAVLVERVHVGLVLEQQAYAIQVPVRRGQVQGGVVAHVGCVDAGAARQQHVGDVQAPGQAGPVERAEAVVVALVQVVLGVVEPEAHLQALALAAPIEYIVHALACAFKSCSGVGAKSGA